MRFSLNIFQSDHVTQALKRFDVLDGFRGDINLT
jgi:hypothetical protein